MFEKALDCIDEVIKPGQPTRYIFTAPIPTLCGLLCNACQVCQICGAPTDEKIMCDGIKVKACLGCTDHCGECGAGKIRHHTCCVVGQ